MVTGQDVDAAKVLCWDYRSSTHGTIETILCLIYFIFMVMQKILMSVLHLIESRDTSAPMSGTYFSVGFTP